MSQVRIQGQALDRLFAVHRQREEYEDAVRAGEESLVMWRAHREPMNDQVLTFLNDLALVHYRAGDGERAAMLLEEVIAHRKQHSTVGTPELALALLNLGTVRQSEGDFVAAESHFLSALAIRRRLLPPNDPATVDALQHLSGLYAAQEDYRRAIPYEEETLAAIRSHRTRSAELARAVNNAATTYYLAGELARSLPLYQEALALVEQDLGRQHPDTAVAMGT